ncbi:MAG: hypothetical protein JRH11_09060 [Deltaproteobacteria bacterium]|nr:hypothetical protein [Deltaproteobacteria bacterium]
MLHKLIALSLFTLLVGCGDDTGAADAGGAADACDGRAILRVCVLELGEFVSPTATVTMIQSPTDVPYEGRVGEDGCTENPVEVDRPWQVTARSPDGCSTSSPTEVTVTACETTEITISMDSCTDG